MTPPLSTPKSKKFQPSAEEGERLLRIITESQLITRHVQLFLWLQSEIQHFLPHQILISAWGDFPNWNLKLDVISALPGVRTEQLVHCGIDEFLKDFFTRWVDGGRRPLVLAASDALTRLGACTCPMHNALRGAHSILVHGVRDERGGYDSLYVALHSRSFPSGRSKERWGELVDLLISQIDAAFRRVAAFRFAETRAAKSPGGDWFDLSAREHEILDGICKGKTNHEIAVALDISPFTVKNHVRRILKKLGAANRTQAAAKYNAALHEVRKVIPK